MSTRYARALSLYRDTSAAAWDAFQQHLGTVDGAIVRVLKVRGAATCEDVCLATDMKHQTVSAQIAHLAKAGVIEDSGSVGRTQAGRAAMRWRLCTPRRPEPVQRSVFELREIAMNPDARD